MCLNSGSQEDTDGVSLPGAAEVRRIVLHIALQIGRAVKIAVLECKASVLVLVDSSLGRVCVLLAPQRSLPRNDLAVLENSIRVPENEVDRANDNAIAIELT